ncbi:MAG TPA: class I adenylate-forming enzyme family protein [Myxococcota bacterium]
MTVIDDIRDRARARPSQPALLSDAGEGRTEALSYAELVGNFDACAKRLAAEGVRPGDRCGLQARQGRGFVELALGILAAGGCLAPIPEDQKGESLEEFAARCRLHHLVSEADASFQLRSRSDAGAVDGCGDREFRRLQPAYLRFTSGTTSRRKGVLLGHATIQRRLDAANRALAIGPEDRVLWLLPMAHHFVVSILLYLRQGAAVLLPGSSLARHVLAFAQREVASVLYASPHHYKLLAKDTSGLGLAGVRRAISTADALQAAVAEQFAARFGFPIAQALGIIEVGLAVANLESAATKPTSLGRPLPDYEVWLRGEDGQPLRGPTSPERTGEICIRGPGLLDAYVDPWLPAREILEPDGFRSGDQGWFDADGDLHLAGRRANRISMAGMKFFAEEVEAVLDAHPEVRSSRVQAREHAHLGEIPVAQIVPRDPSHPPTRAALAAHCRERLPGYKIPREFRVVDALPLTSSGKLQRGDGRDA